MNFIRSSLQEAQQTLNRFVEDDNNVKQIEQSIQLFVDAFKNGGRVFSCGNGGSMCDSLHFAEELTGRYRKDRRPLPATVFQRPVTLLASPMILVLPHFLPVR